MLFNNGVTMNKLIIYNVINCSNNNFLKFMNDNGLIISREKSLEVINYLIFQANQQYNTHYDNDLI